MQRSGLRPEPTEPVLGGLNGQSIARCLTTAAKAAGIDGRISVARHHRHGDTATRPQKVSESTDASSTQ